MSRQRCDEIQERIALYTEGWLPEAERRRLSAHLASCEQCARAARLDSRLAQALGTLPAEAPPALTWTQVRASRKPARRYRRPFYAATATAGAAALLLFAAMRPHEPQTAIRPIVPPPPIIANAASPAPQVDAHDLMSAAETTADPNRAVLLIYAARQETKIVR